MKTFMPKAADITRQWYVVDAEGQVFGRVASQVANILRGKNKPIYTPNVDTGDYVIIINADKIVMTGKKLGSEDLLSSHRLCRRPEGNQVPQAAG